jgi:glycosidase
MAWFDEAMFYHIYPLGLAGAPKENDGAGPGKGPARMEKLTPWLDHARELGCNAVYLGPVFESMTHGYDTVDYGRVDSRLGANADLAKLVAHAHDLGMRVILDGVFNHVGRDHFAVRDLLEHREGARYAGWIRDVNFWGNNSYGDGLSYGTWGGYDALVRLDLRNPEVRGYLLDTVRSWVAEYDIDGLRLDAADQLEWDFLRELKALAREVKPDFWLMGEVIHGEYNRWVGPDLLDSVTNYALNKGLWSGHNDHNYFEIAHTEKRLADMGGGRPLALYNFADNHDVDRVAAKLADKAHLKHVYALIYTLPGCASVYYGSEFGLDQARTSTSDTMLRPELDLADYADCFEEETLASYLRQLAELRAEHPALSYGTFRDAALTCDAYAYERACGNDRAYVCLNNRDETRTLEFGVPEGFEPACALGCAEVACEGGRVRVELPANDVEILVDAACGKA